MEVSVSAKIVELDKANRTAVLKGPKGQLVPVNVSPEVKNLDQVQVGDQLTVRYVAALAALLEPVPKGSSGASRERVENTGAAKAASGGLPSGGAARTVEVVATVQALDPKARTATLRGPKRTVTLDLPPDIDLSKVKVGDDVRAVFIEAVAVSIERPASAPAK
jgi:hypothetical protein